MAARDKAQEMKRDWDSRARENAKWFINLAKLDESDAEFFATGKIDVDETILTDSVFLDGRDPRELRLLEIGCGIGRMTRHLASAFSEVHGVDVSGEMIALARSRLSAGTNVFLHETTGVDFQEIESDHFDRVYSLHVFQHVPEVEVIRSNIREALRVLKPGGLFKFQVNGVNDDEFDAVARDTWTGASFPEAEIRRVARELDAQLVSIEGEGTFSCWAILRKRVDSMREDGATARIVHFGKTGDPRCQEIPVSGPGAGLTLILSGVASGGLDANSVVADIDGKRVQASYAGGVREAYAFFLERFDLGKVEDLAQVNFRIPADVSVGRQVTRVRIGSGEGSVSVEIAFRSAEPVPPRIYYASNSVDGGVDISAAGPKSRFRVFVYDLDRHAEKETTALYLNETPVEIEEINYVVAGKYHELIAQLPPGTPAGEHEISVLAGGLKSECVRLSITSDLENLNY